MYILKKAVSSSWVKYLKFIIWVLKTFKMPLILSLAIDKMP